MAACAATASGGVVFKVRRLPAQATFGQSATPSVPPMCRAGEPKSTGKGGLFFSRPPRLNYVGGREKRRRAAEIFYRLHCAFVRNLGHPAGQPTVLRWVAQHERRGRTAQACPMTNTPPPVTARCGQRAAGSARGTRYPRCRGPYDDQRNFNRNPSSLIARSNIPNLFV